MKAIDVHVHVPDPPGHPAAKEKEDMAAYFGINDLPKTPEELYEKYKALDVFGVIFSIDAETNTGVPYIGNDYVAEVARKYADQFIGFASVDPLKGQAAVRELERAVQQLDLRGLKLHPTTQAFFFNDQKFYALWEDCAGLEIPVLFHSVQTGVGAR